VRTAAHHSDLEAAAQAMLAPVKTASRAEVRATLATKCPRFVPSAEPVLPFLSVQAQLRQIVECLPAWVEVRTIQTTGGVGYEFGKARAASMKAA
jgi:hypothetical protein